MGPRSTHRRHPACVAACAATLLFAAAPPAPAATEDPWLAGLAERVRGDPVVVSDSVSRALSARELAQLRADVSAMPVPTRVAILSGAPYNFDVQGPELSELPDLLAGAIDRPGLYVVADATDDGILSVHTTAMSVRARLAPHDIDHAVAMDVVPGTRVAARVRYALRAAATGRRPLRDAATRELNASESHYDDPARTENAVAIVAAGGAGIAGFVIPTVRWWRRRPGRRAGVAPVVREPGPEAAQEASEALQRVAATIAAAEHPADEAFDLYSAASKAQQEARTPVDSVGVLVLAHDAEAVLAGGPRPRRCFFDPGHPGETTPTRWRLGREEAEVPACPRCVRALHAGRAPDALGDRGRPYYERDTVWARTGFGTIDDELAAKVLAGR